VRQKFRAPFFTSFRDFKTFFFFFHTREQSFFTSQSDTKTLHDARKNVSLMIRGSESSSSTAFGTREGDFIVFLIKSLFSSLGSSL
jgi:hypothetical protein